MPTAAASRRLQLQLARRALTVAAHEQAQKNRQINWQEAAQVRGSRKLADEAGRKSRKRFLLDELKLCSSSRNLRRGQEVHAQAMETGHHSCIYIATALVAMYSKCGSMIQARKVFDAMKQPDVVSWTAIILGYAENGDGLTSLDMFSRMKSRGCNPDAFTFVAALKACTALALEQSGSRRAECLEWGRQIHSGIGCNCDIYVQSTLVDMYAKCGSMVEARRVFDSIEDPNVVAWNALIMGYAENGDGRTALELLDRMRRRGCAPGSVTFIAALKAAACVSLSREGNGKEECRRWVKRVHSEISCGLDVNLQNTLIDVYAKCGGMSEARQVFDRVKQPDVVSWTALILGYAENGEGHTALALFARMKSEGCTPNHLTFVAALKACGMLGALESGIWIHGQIDSDAQLSPVLLTTLVDFYAKCGCLVKAQEVFDSHPKGRDLTTWTALLSGYSRVGDGKAAFELFEGLQDAGFRPDAVTFLCMLTCCSHAGLVEKAEEMFETMFTSYGVAPTVEHCNCMTDILCRSSNRLDAAVAALRRMPCRPNAVTWMTVLGACQRWKNVEIGKLAFSSLVGLGETNAAAYVLMADIYGSRGM